LEKAECQGPVFETTPAPSLRVDQGETSEAVGNGLILLDKLLFVGRDRLRCL